jgi:hypothetical protein
MTPKRLAQLRKEAEESEEEGIHAEPEWADRLNEALDA